METFKQFMGLVMLWATVVLFWLFIGDYKVQTFAMFMALWCTCWWIGKTPLTAELGEKLRGWTIGAAFSVAAGVCIFTPVATDAVAWVLGTAEIAWQPFSQARLDQLRAEGKTVLIDFTADW
jgi:thiol:disulfide interchange protein